MIKIDKIYGEHACGCILNFNQFDDIDKYGQKTHIKNELTSVVVRGNGQITQTKLCDRHRHFSFNLGTLMQDVYLTLNTYDIENGFLKEDEE